jgi:hypothetical protein
MIRRPHLLRAHRFRSDSGSVTDRFYLRCAHGVVLHAVMEARSIDKDPFMISRKNEAICFLRSADCEFWCDLSGLRYESVTKWLDEGAQPSGMAVQAVARGGKRGPYKRQNRGFH